MTEVRTRFAPSPTGFLHIGGVRTAFYAWLFAKHHGGKFVLRIEDTDRERLVPEAIRFILEEFKWYGITPDEGPSLEDLKNAGEAWEGAPDIGGDYGPYIQSLRVERYQKAADELIQKGAAYRCDCTPEMLDKERAEQMARKERPGYSGYCRSREVPADRPHVVRFKMPHKPSLSIIDAVKGRISWESVPLQDPIIMKTGGYPTYHLAVVVDDHAMKISHVMRADEWIPSTPLHILLYQALGYELPIFAHLPAILGSDGRKKLGKRDGSVSSSAFREGGYIPEALLNFAVLIGWSPGEGEEQEVFTKDELISRFSLEGVNKASGVFDYNKLNWMNGLYLRNLPLEKFNELALPYLKGSGFYIAGDPGHESKWNFIAKDVQERIKVLTEIVPMVEFLFVDKIQREFEDLLKKGMTAEKAISILDAAEKALTSLDDFTVSAIESKLDEVLTALELKKGQLLTTIRIAVTGKKATPPLFESMAALGKEESLKRMSEAKEELAKS